MSDLPPSELMVGYLVKRVQHALRRHSDAALAPTGLTMSQYAVLRGLADRPDASAAELARLCFVTRQSLQDVLSALRTRGLVTDGGTVRGRAKSLRLTTTGRRALDAGADVMAAVEGELTQGISAASRKRMVEQLIRCAENLES